MSGAFRKILNQFPDVEKKLIDHIEKNNSSEQNVHEKKIRAKTLHKIFLQELKKKGVQQSEWPFNTKYRAFKTIQNYLNEILNESFGRTVYSREEQSAIAHLAVGTGFERLVIFENPYDAAGRSFGPRVYLSGEFTTSLSVLRYAREDGFIVENKPQTDRIGASANIYLTKALSLLVVADYTRDEGYNETRVLSGLSVRF